MVDYVHRDVCDAIPYYLFIRFQVRQPSHDLSTSWKKVEKVKIEDVKMRTLVLGTI